MNISTKVSSSLISKILKHIRKKFLLHVISMFRLSWASAWSKFVANITNLFRSVILIGDVSVGKTCLLSRYLKNQLPKSAGPTIGVEFATKNVIMKDGATVKA